MGVSDGTAEGLGERAALVLGVGLVDGPADLAAKAAGLLAEGAGRPKNCTTKMVWRP